MIVVNESHHSVGWTVTKLRPPSYSATFVAKGTYALKPGGRCVAVSPLPLCGDEFAEEDPSLALRYPSDFAPYKPRMDVLVVGRAHAPGGKPVGAMRVGFRIGPLVKALAVIGDRSEARGTPQPFATMDLSLPNAFGGPGYRPNPLGKGATEETSSDGRRIRRLPNIERIDVLIDGGSEPAGFGPIPMAWEARLRKAGTYGKKYRKERWPWFPEDMDWSLFNAAPEDQQLPAPLKGDEATRFENLHPTHSVYESTLPGVRVRCFTAPEGGTDPHLREIKMILDTLWCCPEEDRLVLVWRGSIEIAADRLPDRGYLLLASESSTDSPRSLADYEVLLKSKILIAPPPLEIIPGPPKPPKPSIPKWVDPELPALQEPVPVPPAEPVGHARESCLARIARKETLEGLDLTRVDLSGLDLQGVSFRKSVLTRANLSGTRLDGADFTDAVLDSADLRKANLTRAVLANVDATSAQLEEAVLLEAVLEGADFSAADLRRANLFGARARNAIFLAARLSGADLRKSDFSSADLARALLSEADLTEACFSEASLQGALGSRMIAERADFARVRAGDSSFGESRFRGLRGPGSIWVRAQLFRSDFSEAELEDSHFSEAYLCRARFTKADLKRARMDGANLRRADLLRIHFLQGSFRKADLTLADAREANLFQAEFFEAVTKETSFQGANLKRTLLA